MFDVLVVSPLMRAMDTANIAFHGLAGATQLEVTNV